jgi:hypothetical protein
VLAFYEYETWSATLRDEYRQRVLEITVLRKIFLVKGDQVTGN